MIFVTLATGFTHPGNRRMHQAFVVMRHLLTPYLHGNGVYYLYRNGQRWLSPQQQEDIRQMFRDAGYKDEVKFDSNQPLNNQIDTYYGREETDLKSKDPRRRVPTAREGQHQGYL